MLLDPRVQGTLSKARRRDDGERVCTCFFTGLGIPLHRPQMLYRVSMDFLSTHKTQGVAAEANPPLTLTGSIPEVGAGLSSQRPRAVVHFPLLEVL